MNKNNQKEFNTPILFLIFNRPDTTKQVFEAIRKIRPKQLFIAADGPREGVPEDIDRCTQTRKVVENIDWPCDVKKLFQEKNLSCRLAPPTAIDWFFENVEQGIILEDDCVPHPSFFYFCENLLEYYRIDEDIMVIGGNNPLQNIKNTTSYRFSKYPLLWGWATWKRAWEKHDINMTSYPNFLKGDKISLTGKSKIEKKFWINLFNQAHKKLLNTWDYPLLYAIWNSEGINIIPSYNMIKNIGFSKEATHTTNPNHLLKDLHVRETKFPLIHPKSKTLDKKKDRILFYTAMARDLTLTRRLKKKARKILEHLKDILKQKIN